MYNESFYPTPETVARRMCALLEPSDMRGRNILEPSAGKGDLAEALNRHMEGDCRRWNSPGYRDRIHCLEVDPELQAALRGKKFPLVGHDFLTWRPDEQYDLIIMNPPFASGDEHLLHAWEILDGGDIICLLNEETLNNPCTARRKQLAAIIAEHGVVERLGACFNGVDAFRKTDVRVALVHLTKIRPSMGFSFEGLEHDAKRGAFDAEHLDGQLASRDVIANMELEFKKCLEVFETLARSAAELAFYSRGIYGNYSTDKAKMLTDAIMPLFEGKPGPEAVCRAYNIFSRQLKKGAWDKVFSLSRFSDLASRTVLREFEAFCKDNASLSFSKENVLCLLESLWGSRDEIKTQCILDAFATLTEYYKENRMVLEGWHSNDAWRVNRRAVLPYCVDLGYGTPRISWRHDKYEKLNDLDRALAFLEGKTLEQVTTICEAFERFSKVRVERGEPVFGELFESTYFECRGYKKGTLHLYFKDKDLWERFNIAACKGRNWLPDDHKTRRNQERGDKKRNERADQFGLPAAV